MDPLSIDNIISPEFGEDGEPQPAEIITYMDVALYKAAAGGRIEEFNNYQGFELESLRTPSHNTVLHVYLATHDPFVLLVSSSGFASLLIRYASRCLNVRMKLLFLSMFGNENWRFKTSCSFIEQILNKYPSLLLQQNAKGQTPLHIAARYGHSGIVKFLIRYHAKAPHGDLEELGMDQLEAMREMLRKTDLESNTALHIAAQYGHVTVVKELLEFEDPDFSYSVNRNQETPLYIAARRGYRSLLTMILNKLKSTAHGGPLGRTALHAAAMAGDAETTRILLKWKENLTQETDENGQTPLHYAAHLGYYSVVKELLKWDKSAAYIADKNSEMTPLLMAARQGHRRIVRGIISCCPDCCEMVDKRGWNLLHFLALRQHSPGSSNFYFQEGGRQILYGSIRNMINEKDARGITPRQLYALSTYNFSIEAVSFKKSQNRKKMVRISKLLKDIMNEEVGEKPVRPLINVRFASASRIENAKEAHLVVATLIVTVAFAAALTVPGGYRSEKGPEEGTAFLIHKAAFEAFVIADALAFLFSLSAVAIHYLMVLPYLPKQNLLFSFDWATSCIFYALVAIVVAFSTGAYAVLKPSPGLAVASCCIGLSVCLFVIEKEVVFGVLNSTLQKKMDD